jgi:hypothetical protein
MKFCNRPFAQFHFDYIMIYFLYKLFPLNVGKKVPFGAKFNEYINIFVCIIFNVAITFEFSFCYKTLL